MDINPPSIDVFRMGIGNKILFSVFAAGLILVILVIALALAFAKSTASDLLILISILAVVVYGLYWLVGEMTTVLTIERGQFVYKNLFASRTLLFSNTRGYRSYRYRGRVIILLPVDPSQKKVKISKFVQHQSELLTWLGEHFPDTDLAELAKEEAVLLQNPSYGEIPEERQRNLAMARKVALWVNILGCALCAALIFLSNPPTALIIGAIAYVPLSFAAVPWSKGIIYFNNKTNSPHPFIGLGIAAGSTGLLIRALMGYSLLEYNAIWIPAGILAFSVWCLMLAATPEFTKRTALDIANAIAFLLILCLYAFGTYVLTNCALDDGPTQTFTTVVSEKNVHHRKNSTNYYISIKSAGPVDDRKIKVERDFYDATQVNDPMYVRVKEGRWGCSWYYLDRK